MVPNNFHPPNAHVLIMEQSCNYGRISDRSTNKTGYSMPFYVQPATREEGHSKVFICEDGCGKKEDIEGEDENFFRSIRPFLIFGKIIGVLPFSGVFGHSWKNLIYKKKSIATAFSYGITIILMFNASLAVVQSLKASKRNAMEIAFSIRATLYFVWGCLIYIYFLRRPTKFLSIFKCWSSTQTCYAEKDTTLRRDTYIIAGTILSSAILENLVLHLEYFRGLDSISGEKFQERHNNLSWLHTYYCRAHPQWSSALGYNWFFAIVGFIQHKWILYTWNYMDVMLAIFGRAMYFRFQSLYEQAERTLLKPPDSEMGLQSSNDNNNTKDACAWIRVVKDHQNLCRLLDVLEDFFSPVVFGSYAINMFYISLQLFDGLTNETNSHSIIHSIYAPWSFIHLVVRAVVVSISLATINTYAHKIRKVFQECPGEYYSMEISRVDRVVTAGSSPIGISGMGTFTVTKPFILTMFSVVFTFEIVLLQCVPSNSKIEYGMPDNC